MNDEVEHFSSHAIHADEGALGFGEIIQLMTMEVRKGKLRRCEVGDKLLLLYVIVWMAITFLERCNSYLVLGSRSMTL